MMEEAAPSVPGRAPFSSSKALDTTAAKMKHAAMLERLSKRHNKSSASPAAAAPPPFESVQSFLDRFSDSRRAVEADIQRCRLHHQQTQGPPGSDPKQDLEKISAAVSDLEKLVAENSYFLPSYEVRTALKSVSDLKDSLEKARTEVLPRKRFAFRNRPTGKRDPIDTVARKVEEDTGVSGEETRPSDPVPREGSKLTVQDSPGFRNMRGALLVKDFRIPEEGLRVGQGDFSLCDLDSCQVCLRGQCRALFIHRLKHCHVFVGPVLGSILIEEVENCVFMLASHQIRIHQARKTDFYLRVRSRPIIEDSNGVRFAPYMMNYEGLEGELRDSDLGDETGNWANVDDFRWLRAIQSPNWCVLPEEERMCNIDISE